MGDHAADLARREVGDQHDLPTDQRLRLVELGHAGQHRPLLRSEAHPELEQLIRSRHPFRREHLCHPQVQLREFVDGDFRGQGSGVRGQRWCPLEVLADP